MLKVVQNHAARFVSTNYNFTSRCHYPYGWAGNGIIKQAQTKKKRLEMLSKFYWGMVKVGRETYLLLPHFTSQRGNHQ